MNKNGVSAVVLACVIGAAAHAGEDHHRDERGSRGNVNHVNSSIELLDGEQAKELHTVNGSIRVGDRAEFTTATTVNGSVRVGEDARAEKLKAVNGRVSIGKRTKVSGDITSVNGRLELDDDTVVEGDARNVNSNISVGQRAHVMGRVVTRNGDITLDDNARVDGGIEVRDDGNGWKIFFGRLFDSDSRMPVVTIGAGAKVGGRLVFERPVELRVHRTATIGEVIGEDVVRRDF